MIEILCNSAVTCKRLTKKSLLERTGPTDSEECKENSKQGMGACPSNPNSSVWMKYLK